MTNYERPTLTETEARETVWAAAKINRILSFKNRLAVITRLVIENALLVKECNQHRAALGYEPLPVFNAQGKEQ